MSDKQHKGQKSGEGNPQDSRVMDHSTGASACRLSWIRGVFAAPIIFSTSMFASASALDSWMAVHSETNTSLLCVAYGDGRFVAAGADGDRSVILESEDGTNWDRVGPSILNATWQGVAYGRGTFLLVGSAGIMVSSNGTVWTQVRSNGEEYLNAVTVGPELFLAGGYSSDLGYQGMVVTSPDGINWTPHSIQTNGGYNGVVALAYGKGQYVAATEYNVLASTDAFNWNLAISDYTPPLYAFAFSPELAVAVGGWEGAQFRPPARVVYTSSTAVDWVEEPEWYGSSLRGVAYGDGIYVAVDESGSILVSDSGACWKETSFNAGQRLNGVAFVNHSFVAVGEQGTIIMSGSIETNVARVRFASCVPYQVREQGGSISIPVLRTGDVSSTAAVHYRSVDGSASAGQDYQAIQGTLTFAPGETKQYVSVPILNDDKPESTEDFTLVLEQPIAAEIGSTDTATVQILDDDSAYLDNWVQSSPVLFAPNLNAVAWNSSAFVAVGGRPSEDGTSFYQVILRSVDGQHWQDVSPGFPSSLWSVGSGGGSFVAGGNGQILSSRDGISWQKTLSSDGDEIVTVCYGNGQFIAAGLRSAPGQFEAVLFTSPDGFTWSEAPLSSGLAPISSVTFGNNVFVASGEGWQSPTNDFLVSTDSTNWSVHPAPFIHGLPQITYGNGLFLVAGSSYAGSPQSLTCTLATSPDGVNWTQTFARTNLYLSLAGFSAGQFVVAGVDSSEDGARDVILRSDDGSTWALDSPLPFAAPTGIAWDNRLNVVVGAGIWTSFQFSSWTQQVSASMDFQDIAFGNGRFVAVGPTILSSVDGRSWTSLDQLPSSTLSGVAFGSGVFVAVANDGTVAISRDGMNWTNPAAQIAGRLSRVAYGSGRFVAIGGTTGDPPGLWTNQTFVSFDGVQWALGFSGTADASPWSDIVYGNGVFVAPVGDNVWTSSDGVNWSATQGNFYELNAATYGAGRFVAVGGYYSQSKYTSSGAIIINSSDGRNWTNSPLPDSWQNSGTFLFSGVPLSGIVYDGNSFVAVGTGSYSIGNTIITSTDGINWTGRQSPIGPGINRIAFGNGRLVAVGQNGHILHPGVMISIESAPSVGNPKLMLNLASEIGLVRAIEVSTNMSDWEVWKSFTNTTFKTLIEDPDAGAQPMRFYRAKGQ